MNACAPFSMLPISLPCTIQEEVQNGTRTSCFLDKRCAAFPVKEAGLNAQSKTKQGGTCVNCSSDTFPESSSFIAEEE